MSKNLKGSIMLFIAAVIWGSAFVAQEESAAYVGSFTLNALRSVVAVAVLFPVMFIFKSNREKQTGIKEKLLTKPLIIGGICCGIALAVAANLQQFGIIFNAEMAEGDSGKAGFITAMYIIFVPLISSFIGKKLRFACIPAVLIAVFGLYFISVKQGFTVSTGDIVLLIGALGYSAQIMAVDHYVTKVDGIALSLIQFITVGVVSGVLMLVFERDSLSVYNITQAIIPILYCGVLSSGIAFTLQIIAQKYAEPTVASLVMSLESVFGMLAAVVYFGKTPTTREIIGCVLMMVAIFVIETPFVDRAFNKVFKKKSAI